MSLCISGIKELILGKYLFIKSLEELEEHKLIACSGVLGFKVISS